jgi:hypothetical protein
LRDERIVSLASSQSLDGYEQGPFSTSVVKRFLTQVAQLRQDLEERAASERVRERQIELIFVVDHYYGFIDDCTGGRFIGFINLYVKFSNWFLMCMDCMQSLQIFSMGF